MQRTKTPLRAPKKIPKSRNPEISSWGLVVVPLHGRGNKNGEGAGVKVLLYHPPAQLNDPKGEWKTELIDESMHMTHNFDVREVVVPSTGPPVLVVAGKEGVQAFSRYPEGWRSLGGAPPSGRAAGESRAGRIGRGLAFQATVEPMHGNTLVVDGNDRNGDLFFHIRKTLTDKLSEGHALACGDLLGTGADQIIVGWRGKPGVADSTTGVAVWTPLHARGEKWRETIIDRDGMACEDLQLADINGDGKLDIVASGRSTKNVKIYFNETGR